MDIEEIGINAGNWVDLAQDRNYWRSLVKAALNLRVPEAMELVMFTLIEGKEDIIKVKLLYIIVFVFYRHRVQKPTFQSSAQYIVSEGNFTEFDHDN